MHTMMMMMMITKTGAENADDYVDAATVTMTLTMMITMVIVKMTMKNMMMVILTNTEADVYVGDTNDDDDTDDYDDDEAFMKISNCSCYLTVVLANPMVSPWK